MVYWLLLLFTIIFEVAGTMRETIKMVSKARSSGTIIFVFYGICFSVFAIVVKKIHLSIAYAIWSGVEHYLLTIISVYFLKSNISLNQTHFGILLLFWCHWA